MWILAGLAGMIWSFIQCLFFLLILWLVCRSGIPTATVRQPVQVPADFANLWGDHCLQCGATDELTWDHIVAVARGGGDHISNLQRLCRRCNSAKNTEYADYRTEAQKQWSVTH